MWLIINDPCAKSFFPMRQGTCPASPSYCRAAQDEDSHWLSLCHTPTPWTNRCHQGHALLWFVGSRWCSWRGTHHYCRYHRLTQNWECERGHLQRKEGWGEDIIKGRDAEKTIAVGVTSQVSRSRAPKTGADVRDIFLQEVLPDLTGLHMRAEY